MALALPIAAVASARAAGPDAGAAPRRSGQDLSVVITRAGLVTRVRFEGERLVAREAGGGEVASRVLSTGERASLLEATRAAVADTEPQWSCPVDPTWLSATIDGKTVTSAFCPERNHWRAHPEVWRKLLAVVRKLLGG